jgi:hypothetical protein
MSKTSIKTIVAAAMLLAALGGTAVAQDNDDGWWPHWGMGRGMMGEWGWRGPMMDFGPDTVLDRIDGRIAFLKTELKITDAQSAAWEEFAGIIRQTSEAHNKTMRSMFDAMRSGDFFKKPLPERVAFQQSVMEARLEQVKSLRQAVDKLYAMLDDNQKKAANEIVLPMMGMGRGMMFRN